MTTPLPSSPGHAPRPGHASPSTTEAVDEISSRVKAEVAEMRQRRIASELLDRDKSVKTRKAAVETTRPSTMCAIL